MSRTAPFASASLLATVLLASAVTSLVASAQAPKKLVCEPGESNSFAYESDSSLWGPIEQKIRLTAEVSVTCLGQDSSRDAFKYMVRVTRVEPKIIRDSQALSSTSDLRPPAVDTRRLKRGAVGDWVRGAWVSVKEWFLNMFKRRSSSSSGPSGVIEIGSKCRSRKGPDDHEHEKTSRVRRAAKRSSGSARYQYDDMFGIPFEFVQSTDGRIVEVLFANSERDTTVKNFKKHLADAFATQLDPKKDKVMETSPIGQHVTRYAMSQSPGAGAPLKQADSGLVKLVAAAFTSEATNAGADQPLNVVRDIWEEDIIKLGSGDDGQTKSHQGQVGLSAKQVQQITEGRVTGAVGKLQLNLLNPEVESTGKTKFKRSTDDNGQGLEHHLKVETQYSLKLISKRTRRSADGAEIKKLMEEEQKLNFVSESILAKSRPTDSAMERLDSLREKMAGLLGRQKDIWSLMRSTGSSNAERDMVLSTMSELLDLEYLLNEDRKDSSVAAALRSAVTVEKIESECGRRERMDINKCRELFLALVKSGSDSVASFLLDSVDFEKNVRNKKTALMISGQANRPNDLLVERLIRKFRGEMDTDLKGHFALAATSLAGQKSVTQKMVDYVVGILSRELEILSCSDNGLVDVFEAIGNLAERDLALDAISKAKRCESESIKVASVHALRRTVAMKAASNYFLELLKSDTTSCAVKREVIEVLSEAAALSNSGWPRDGSNDIDEHLMNPAMQNECFVEQLSKYMERKSDDKAKATLKALALVQHRSRRAAKGSDASSEPFWDDSSCKVFDKPTELLAEPIRVKDNSSPSSSRRRGKELEREELDPNVSYVRRRKCTAHKYFGLKQARANIRADIVNDLIGSESDPEYKLLAQFAVGSHFLGKDVDVGKMYLYNRKDSSRAYVNLFGRTLLDAARNNCDSSPGQPYRYSAFVPLYDFNVWSVQVSLGLRFAGEMALNPVMSCDQSGRSSSSMAFLMSPDASLRTSGEASAKVLVVRGGIDVGGDFNYFSDLEFAPKPELCLTAYSGHRPMNVSVQSWYSFWDLPCSEWMDRNFWKPESLSWSVSGRQRSPWIDNKCLLTSKRSDDAIDP